MALRPFLSFALLLACACAAGKGAPSSAAGSPAAVLGPREAVLGIETDAPSEELAEQLDLPFHVRQQCRVVASATGPAASAGVRAGDVLFAIGDVDLYSQDDLDDVLRVSRPEDEVVLALKRGESAVQKIKVVLGAGPTRAPGGIAWRYASLANLPRALEEARGSRTNVLVGLSGAET